MTLNLTLFSYLCSRIDGGVHGQHFGVLLSQDVVEADVAFDLRLVVNELQDRNLCGSDRLDVADAWRKLFKLFNILIQIKIKLQINTDYEES